MRLPVGVKRKRPSGRAAAYAEAIARLTADRRLRERIGAAVVEVYREVTAPGFRA